MLGVFTTRFILAKEVPRPYGDILHYVMKNRPKAIVVKVFDNGTVVSDNEHLEVCGHIGCGVFSRR